MCIKLLAQCLINPKSFKLLAIITVTADISVVVVDIIT